MALASLLASNGCASLYELDPNPPRPCIWVALEADALEVIGARREPSCTALQAPDAYRLTRTGYTVEFWNGEGYYPDLLLRAFTPGGERLRVQSADLWGGFDYSFIDRQQPKNPYNYRVYAPAPPDYHLRVDRVEFTVLGVDGQELGRESIRLIERRSK